MTSGTDEINCPHCKKVVHIFTQSKIKVNEAWHPKEEVLICTTHHREYNPKVGCRDCAL